MRVEQRRAALALAQPHLVLVAAVVVEGLRLGTVTSDESNGWCRPSSPASRHPELLGRLDDDEERLVLRDLAICRGLGQVHVVPGR